MKLLKIINIRYLVSSVLIVIMLGFVLSYVLSYMANEETDEKIMIVYKRLTSHLDKGQQVCSMPPYFEITQIQKVPNQLHIDDTILKDKKWKKW